VGLGFSQYNQQVLFPDLEGEALLEKLVEEYKAQIIFMDYGESRDTLFSKVYMKDDSLKCVYSGHTLFLDPNRDPTTFVYMNGSDNGINTEHTYPRSKGAEFGNPKSDMHHLFPTRSKVNEERSNFPFGEIDDDETDLWFYKNQSSFSKPTQNIDAYSEWKWQIFEPREDHKGNVARAIFYFYTMYKDLADAEDPDFFWDMVPTLCEWHLLDPVDSLEWERTYIIAKYQQFPNPFVLDCSLVSRTYCEMTENPCTTTVPVQDFDSGKEENWNVAFNPSTGINITPVHELSGLINIHIYNASGQKVMSRKYNMGAKHQTITLAVPDLDAQVYFINITYKEKGVPVSISKKIITF
jgi:endonuclease I